MKKSDIPAIGGLCVAFGTPFTICLGLLVQLVPHLDSNLKTIIIIVLLFSMGLSIIGFYFSMKNGSVKQNDEAVN